MSVEERQTQFKKRIWGHAGIRADLRIAENFGFSNSAHVIDGGRLACTNNLKTYSPKLTDSPSRAVSLFVCLCVLTIPPQGEIYFAIVVSQDAEKLNSGLVNLARGVEARNKPASASRRTPSSINNYVKFYITANGNPYFGAVTLRPSMSVEDITTALKIVVTDAVGG